MNQAQNLWQETSNPNTIGETPEGERGLGATVFGGTGGTILGHHFGKKPDHGTLGTVGGALAGTVLANMAGNAIKGNHGHRGAGGRRRERLERKIDRLS
ncbi:hypothetical protein N7478_007099 [Penicillium angulare]|uniref:uncharacterized protein n=1 Tax=Penicillium angulare TaxID=116970 RepID=UPI0025413AD7|nr:uncharacterized protein N7478_007099 [Penicillium angulare]KAJ5281727.1 hypothetical protein N7478_007099 [Penicillium angulare]